MDAAPARRRVASLVAAAAVGVAGALLAGCSPAPSDGGRIVVTDDDRIDEVRAARTALGPVVPAATAEAERLVGALASIWAESSSSAARTEQVDALRVDPFRTALDELEAVEVEGAGPDVEAAREVVEAMVAEGRAVLVAVEEELDGLTAAGAFDAELEELLAGWDARGSYSQQLTAFEEMARAAEQLSERAAGRTAVPACTELWPRREQAAATVATRTEELRALVQDRRGQEFDELRDEFGQDPYGLGAFLAELDAEAAARCWSQESDAAAGPDLLAGHTEELEAVLDPADLRG